MVFERPLARIARLLTGLLLIGNCTVAFAEATLLTFERIVDGTGNVLDAQQILVRDGVIVEVGNDLDSRFPAAASVDLSELTALPGLIDVHTHLTYGFSREPRGDAWAALFDAPAHDRLVAAIDNAKRTLRAGVTTTRDLSSFDGVDQHLKALIEAGVVAGPRIFSAGTPLHPMTLQAPADRGEDFDIAAFFAAHAEQRAREGGSWVKIFATSGSADDLTDEQQFFYPEIKAATAAAHARGLKVAVHSYGPSAVRDALKAGVDSIEHPVGVDRELLELWARTDTYYVPTIDHNRYYADHRDEYGYGDDVARDLHRFIQRNVETLSQAHAAGIKLAMGSDAVMTMFGQNTRELTWFVEAGLSPREIIPVATVNGAHLLGQAGRLGRLKQGFVADIIAVRGNPLDDIEVVIDGVEWVMMDGQVVVPTPNPKCSQQEDKRC